MNAATATAIAAAIATPVLAAPNDRETVAALDIAYQAAVKRGDLATMETILHPQFVLVRPDGGVVTRAELLAGEAQVAYEVQDEDPGTQTVRVFGDTAVVTARLHLKGVRGGTAFDRLVWFSDTYVRTPDGWRYAFAQVSEAPAAQRGSGR